MHAVRSFDRFKVHILHISVLLKFCNRNVSQLTYLKKYRMPQQYFFVTVSTFILVSFCCPYHMYFMILTYSLVTRT